MAPRAPALLCPTLPSFPRRRESRPTSTAGGKVYVIAGTILTHPFDKLPNLATEGTTLRRSAQGALDKLPNLATEGATLRTKTMAGPAGKSYNITSYPNNRRKSGFCRFCGASRTGLFERGHSKMERVGLQGPPGRPFNRRMTEGKTSIRSEAMVPASPRCRTTSSPACP